MVLLVSCVAIDTLGVWGPVSEWVGGGLAMLGDEFIDGDF